MIDKNTKTIIIRCPNWVGDLIMATPVFECLKKAYPDTFIIALARTYNMQVIEDNPFIDKIIACEDKTAKGFLSSIKEIKTFKPDIAILLTNSFRSWFLMKLSLIKEIYGYKRSEHKFFIKGPYPEKNKGKFVPVSTFKYYLDLLRWLGVEVKDEISTSLFISEELKEKGEKLFLKFGIDKNDFVIALNPGAKFGSSKCWPTEHFALLADMLSHEFKCKILLLGGPGELELALEIVNKSKVDIINLVNHLDLAILKSVLKRVDLLVTNDTGPRHYSEAFKKPLIVLMGPTSPVHTASNFDKLRVLRLDLECSPCQKKVCPLGHHKCMRDLKPIDVTASIKELLSK